MSGYDYLSDAQHNAAYGYKGVAMATEQKFEGEGAEDPSKEAIGEKNYTPNTNSSSPIGTQAQV